VRAWRERAEDREEWAITLKKAIVKLRELYTKQKEVIIMQNVGFKVLTAANMAVCWMLSRKVWQKLKDDSVSTASIIRTRRSHFGTSNDRIFHHKLASASKTLFTSL
jgi:hypothetical protein